MVVSRSPRATRSCSWVMTSGRRRVSGPMAAPASRRSASAAGGAPAARGLRDRDDQARGSARGRRRSTHEDRGRDHHEPEADHDSGDQRRRTRGHPPPPTGTRPDTVEPPGVALDAATRRRSHRAGRPCPGARCRSSSLRIEPASVVVNRANSTCPSRCDNRTTARLASAYFATLLSASSVQK